MNKGSNKTGGYALITGSILAVLTMGLHPTGGNFNHIKKILPINIAAHSIGILALLVMLFGFVYLKNFFAHEKQLSLAAFIATAAGLCAGILAATLNGLALSIFIGGYENPSPDMIDAIKPVMKYNFALNKAFDYIMITALNIAFFLWSVIMLGSKQFPKWLAYLGFVLNTAFLLLVFARFSLVDLRGFTVFVAGIVSWIILAGWHLQKQPEKNG
jgi:hypothetical protein